MCQFKSLKKENGYTLLETIFQMMIFALFTQLFLLFFYWKAPIERQLINRSAMQWEMFAVDFQEELVNLSQFEVLRTGKGIRLQTKRGIIVIEEKNKVIRKTVDGQGHVPFLTEVTAASFTQNDPTTLHVEVTLHDGTKKGRDFAIGKYPK